MSPGSRRSTLSMHDIRHMPAIAEDDSDAPPRLPEKSARRSGLGLVNGNDPYNFYPPPAYSIETPSSKDKDEPFDDSCPPLKREEPGWFIRRGGWCRVALIVCLLAACIIAVALGLTLGLKRGSSSDSTPSDYPYPLVFPAGSYAFTTALSSISTACTSNPNTFRCYPYTTYNSSQSGASATFFWTITQVGPWAYVVSAASNPFVPQFTNVTLTLLDSNQATERLTFNFSMNAAVIPSSPLNTSTNAAATCYFNHTVVSATLWTRKPAEFPRNLTSSVSSDGNGTHTSSNFDSWPYAVQLAQVAGSGSGTPDCRDSSGRPVGSFELPAGTTGDCSCSYNNFGLGS